MSKKLIAFVGAGIISFSLIFLNGFDKKETVKKGEAKSSPITRIVSPSFQPLKETASESIFIPYWTDFKRPLEINSYNRAIYFGVEPGIKGYDIKEDGYRKLSEFVNAVPENRVKFLTIRMVNPDSVGTILENKQSWKKIINDSIVIATEYKFNGLVLDLEVTDLPFLEVIKNINSFVDNLSKSSKQANLSFSIAVYGDAVYRKRPYDLKFLADHSDEVMIMAYDFHKSRGEPGPNFPLRGKDKFSYDFETLIKDFSVIPLNKLSVIFGMYGYDWTVDEQKRPIKRAVALSDIDITKQFINNCQWKNCTVYKDSVSAETEVNYIDDETFLHIVWFEDQQSVVKKQEYLKKQGIVNYAYWTYGYF